MSGCFTNSDLQFKLPFGMVVAGSSSSGKTTWLRAFMANVNELVSPVPKSIVYAYGEYHDYVPDMEKMGISTFPGLPEDEVLQKHQKPLLLILDDLMTVATSKYLSDLYTKKSHHQNIGVIFLTQDLFDKNIKVARNNSQYIVLMKAPNSALSVRTLGSQLFPGQLSYFMDAYRKSTEQPYGYLILDMHASTNPLLKLRTHIFPGDLQTVFIP